MINICLILALLINCTFANLFTWRSDIISIKFSGGNNNLTHYSVYYLNVDSNGEIDQDDGGHIQFNITGISNQGQFSGISSCFPIGSSQFYVSSILMDTPLKDVTPNSSYLFFKDISEVSIKKFGDGKSATNFSTSYVIDLKHKHIRALSIDIEQSDCVPPRTIADWNDKSNWDLGYIPSILDDVVLPLNSGKVVLSNDVTVNTLVMNGGLIVAEDHTCPSDWSTSPDGGTMGKCYKLYDQSTTYVEADGICRGVGYGSLGTLLVQIENDFELDLVKSMCRGDSDSSPFLGGCWIGLQDAFGTGFYNWRDPDSMQDLSFRDWRRGSDNSDRENLPQAIDFVNNGDNCAVLVPWQEDVLMTEQGSFDEISCTSQRAFVCQQFMVVKKFKLTVIESAIIEYGGIQGGYLQVNGDYTINNFHGDRTSTLIVGFNSTEQPGYIHNIYLRDGSSVIVQNNVNILPNSFIGETSTYGLQPSISFGNNDVAFINNCHDIVSSSCVAEEALNSTINARVLSLQGNIVIEKNVQVNFLQGGDVSNAYINVESETSLLELGGYATRFTAFDSFELTLSHRSEVIGENYPTIISEELYKTGVSAVERALKGVYRIQVSYANGSFPEYTQCIPYNATAPAMYEYLSQIEIVQKAGGITVRRTGSGDYRYNYGYTYRFDFDSPSTQDIVSGYGNLNLMVYCVGTVNCSCAQTVVKNIDNSGQAVCPLTGFSAHLSFDSCAIDHSTFVTQKGSLGYTKTSGEGSFLATGGMHRLPPVTDIWIGCSGKGRGTVNADVIDWKGFMIGGYGKIIFAGAGWEGWDSSVLIFSSQTTKGRGNDALNYAPSFSMTAEYFLIEDIGEMLTAGPKSNLTWGSGIWNGGIIGGRSTVYISQNISLTGGGKSLRYACTLFINENATMNWSSGNISLSNGAKVIMEGDFYINVVGEEQYFGYSAILSMPYEAPYQNLLEIEPALNKLEYFDDSLAQVLRKGFYINPLCGDLCLVTPTITSRKKSKVNAISFCNATIASPLNFEDYSYLQLNQGGYLRMHSGGGCGNDVILEIQANSKVDLSGGQFFMGATCTITGSGELEGSAGTHDLSFSINAHITISGGILRWPASRGPGYSLRFYGGLLIEKQGVLLVEAQETTVVVDEIVEFKDECKVEFPRIGTAAQPSVFDLLSAPDDSPRGNLTATNIMKWHGGTLSGKASFFSNHLLYLGGGLKNIKSLAKLVNNGHAEWFEGDIVMSDQADFVNLGTIQVSNGSSLFDANNYFKGTILPLESGGDAFALDFHSWDLDQGGLDFTEYIQLRTEFVSRAPGGWTEGDQVETW